MKELIRKILKEETSVDQKETIQDLIKDFGYETAIKYLGGVDNFINIMYDGDLIKFSEDTTTPITYLSTDGMNLYLHEVLVYALGFKDAMWRGEKELGDFKFRSNQTESKISPGKYTRPYKTIYIKNQHTISYKWYVKHYIFLLVLTRS